MRIQTRSNRLSVYCPTRQEVSAMRADFVHLQAQEQAFYAQQVAIVHLRSPARGTQPLHFSQLYYLV